MGIFSRVSLSALMSAASLSCGVDDERASHQPTPPMGRENGDSCFFSGAGARACGGGHCLGIFESDIGICSQPCTTECTRGGVCGAIPNGERFCLVDCLDDSECGDEFVRCLPALEGILVCVETFECRDPDPGTKFCLPYDPNNPPP